MRGSIVLMQYPFSDLSSIKARPAVILTPNDLLPRIDDVLCLFLSSVVPEDLLPSDFVLEKDHSSFAGTGLRFRSVFRAHKLALLHKSLVFRILGAADEDLMVNLNGRLRIALGIE
jgi:mRNA interferase MazF